MVKSKSPLVAICVCIQYIQEMGDGDTQLEKFNRQVTTCT